jgi:hypothetical protein
MITTTTYTDFSRNGIISSRMRIINKLLLHDVLTRKELSEQLGVSIATVTNHTQDLIANKILLSETIPGINSKRPLQKLSLNGGFGVCSTILLDPHMIIAELVKLDSTPLASIKVLVKSATQANLLATLEEAAGKLEALAEVRGEKIISGMIGIQGTVSPHNRVIFSIDGISDWKACSPLAFLKYFESNPVYNLSTWIMAKCKGFSRLQQCDCHIGIIEFSNNEFHIAAIYNEQMGLGHLGTSSPQLHCEVENGLACYCGKNKCFNAYIQSGGFDSKIINAGLNKVFEEIHLSLVGLEFAEHPQTVKKICDNGLHVKPVLVENGYELYQNGLRMLAAENAWERILNNIFANKK